METYSTLEITRLLKERNISLFTLDDFGRIFRIQNQNTMYKKIQRLEKKKIIQKLQKGKYLFLLNSTNDFHLANFMRQPSYVSLESALSFYGIISGFPYRISSITPKKSRTITVGQKEFAYSHIRSDLFWGYEKKEDFLIADREKGLLDYIYFYLKGLRTIDWKDLDSKGINTAKLLLYGKKFKDYRVLKIITKLI